jgi:hypothetical protein
MKLPLCLKLLASGTIALGAIAAIHQPASACPVDDPTPSCLPSQTSIQTTPSPAYVVPTVPVTSPLMPVVCMDEAVSCQPSAIVLPQVTPDSFFCNRDGQGNPTTFISTPNGVYPLINWVSYFFARSGFDPQVRCQEVSNRFDRYYREGSLNYITTGIINRHPVVCVASEIGGPCTGILLTLKPNENASQVVQQLFNVRASIPDSVYTSGTRQYIDVRRYLESARTPQL